jgi:hypothetical protein
MGWILPTSLSVAGLLTTTMAVGVIFAKAVEGTAPVLLYLFLTPFLLMGLVLFLFGARGLFRLARYGAWALSYPDDDGWLGTPVSVRLLPRREVTPSDRLQCRLSCVERVVFDNRGSARNSEVPGGGTGAVQDQNITLWHTEWSVPRSTIRPGTGVEIVVPVPQNGKPTSVDSRTGAGIRWHLNIQVPAGNLSHQPMFEIPVRAR